MAGEDSSTEDERVMIRFVTRAIYNRQIISIKVKVIKIDGGGRRGLEVGSVVG